VKGSFPLFTEQRLKADLKGKESASEWLSSLDTAEPMVRDSLLKETPAIRSHSEKLFALNTFNNT
jgi:hypothetical protein